jgi:hypothetical protein
MSLIGSESEKGQSVIGCKVPIHINFPFLFAIREDQDNPAGFVGAEFEDGRQRDRRVGVGADPRA